MYICITIHKKQYTCIYIVIAKRKLDRNYINSISCSKQIMGATPYKRESVWPPPCHPTI